MKLFIAKLLLLGCAIATHALHIRSAPHSVQEACPSAFEVDSTIINVDGHEIRSQIFVCSDGNFTAPVPGGILVTDPTSHPRPSSLPPSSEGALSKNPSLLPRPTLPARSQSECTTPASECQCGTDVDCACFSNGPAPSTSDCNTLIGSTNVLASIQGPTFLVQPNNFRVITLNTCTLGFLNLGNTVEEFCWDDLASQANRVVGCPGAGLTGGGFCLSNNQRYLTRLGHAAV